MKKISGIFILIALLASCTFYVDDTKKDTPSKTTALKKGFICPMNCENGKVYDSAGTCPVCKMELEATDKK